MFKFFSSIFAVIVCVMSSTSAGFLSATPGIYRASVAAPTYAAATYVAGPPLTKFVRAYAAGPPLTNTYATTSYSATPYYSADPWTGYSGSSLGGYVAAPAPSIKYFTPATGYQAAYAAPGAVYRASYSAPAFGYGYAAPTAAAFAHAGYAQTTYSQSGYNFAPFHGIAAPAPVAIPSC